MPGRHLVRLSASAPGPGGRAAAWLDPARLSAWPGSGIAAAGPPLCLGVTAEVASTVVCAASVHAAGQAACPTPQAGLRPAAGTGPDPPLATPRPGGFP